MVGAGEAHGATPGGDATIGGTRVHQIRCLCGCDLSRVGCGIGATGTAAGWARRRARSGDAAPADRANPARARLRAAGNAGAKRRGLSGTRHRPIWSPSARRDRCPLRRHPDGAADRHVAARRLRPAAVWCPAGPLRRPADGRSRRLSAAARGGSTAGAYRYAQSGASPDPAAETGRQARGGHVRAGRGSGRAAGSGNSNSDDRTGRARVGCAC